MDFLMEDINSLCNSKDIKWDKFKEKSILVTGATGLIGSLICKTFLEANKRHNLNLNIIALVRNPSKAESILGSQDGTLHFVLGDMTGSVSVDYDVDFVFHCASVTTSKTMISNPVETIMTSVLGTRNMLAIAREKKSESFVYISSMEMYGTFNERTAPVTENDLGYINPLAIRSNYPESKRLCENMCVAYNSEYGVNVKIARLAQTFGAGILPGENRVFAQFARAAINHENIVLHTKGLSESNFCYTTDAIKGLITIALKGKAAEAYNVANPAAHTTIADMAKLVADKFGEGQTQVVFDIPADNKFGYASDVKMKLSADKLM